MGGRGGRGGEGGGEADSGGGGKGDSGKRVRQRPSQVKKINRLMRGVNIWEERMRLVKGNITRNPNVTSNRIPTVISLALIVITKKNTLDRLHR
jgi:hypothetical protein